MIVSYLISIQQVAPAHLITYIVYSMYLLNVHHVVDLANV